MATGDPTRLFLARHGSVDVSWHGRVYGDLDAPLSRRGEAEAQELAERLSDRPLAAVLSSGLARAEYGAAALRAGRLLERRDDRALLEIDRGEWRGLPLAEIEERWPGAWARWWADPDHDRPPGGETLADLMRRVVPCVEKLAREFPGAEVAVVAHSWVIRVAVCRALGLPSRAATRLDLPPSGLCILDWPCGEPGELCAPVLAGFAADSAPDRADGWFRGPRR